jgi:hypothetical protein
MRWIYWHDLEVSDRRVNLLRCQGTSLLERQMILVTPPTQLPVALRSKSSSTNERMTVACPLDSLAFKASGARLFTRKLQFKQKGQTFEEYGQHFKRTPASAQRPQPHLAKLGDILSTTRPRASLSLGRLDRQAYRRKQYSGHEMLLPLLLCTKGCHNRRKRRA